MSFAMGSAVAMDQPPGEPQQQHAWLIGHLVTDMKDLGIYSADDFAKVSDMVNDMTDDQVALLSQYYYLTRAKTQQDAGLFAMQQHGYSDADVDGDKAQIADILTQLQDEIDACHAELQTLGSPAQYLGQVVYSSAPGWCVRSRCCVPEWYCAEGCYVGCAFNSAYCGNYAQPVCAAYYDNGSYFNSVYDRSAYIARSINRARRQADHYRNQNWQSSFKHDRFVGHGTNPYPHGANRQLGQNGKIRQGGHDGGNRNGSWQTSQGKHLNMVRLAGHANRQFNPVHARPSPRPVTHHVARSQSHVRPKPAVHAQRQGQARSRPSRPQHAARAQPQQNSRPIRSTQHVADAQPHAQPRPAAHAQPQRHSQPSHPAQHVARAQPNRSRH
jgi:hypothetical protein